MSEYLHGAYGDTQNTGFRVAARSDSAIVVIGTAPVHTVAGGAANVNVPKLVNNIAEARKLFGYSENWADFTLCEAMHHFFENKAIGPLVLINVFDPAVHKASQGGTKSLTPVNNRVTVTNAESVVLDSVVVKNADQETLVKGTDYSIGYSIAKQSVIITGLTAGSLGTDALTITYDIADPSAVDADDVIGASDGLGENTGLYAIKNVYQLTGTVPAYLIAPGFSDIPAVHEAMRANTVKVNGHWDMWMFTDLPLTDSSTPLTMETVVQWKETHGYDKENETVYFPMAQGADGKKYHLSVLAAANFAELLAANDGIPYHSASNTEAVVIEKLYMGEANEGKVFDDSIINEKLNKNGIASAAFVGGRWVIWGAHAADYTPKTRTR